MDLMSHQPDPAQKPAHHTDNPPGSASAIMLRCVIAAETYKLTGTLPAWASDGDSAD